MLKAPLVCDRNGNNLLVVESAAPFVTSQSNKAHKSNQGSANAFPRPQIKVEKEDEEDLKVGEDFAVQKSNSSADDKARASTTNRMPALGSTNVSVAHATVGRRSSAKATRNALPTPFIHQQMRHKMTGTSTGDIREVQRWTSNFQPENDNKNANKE
jgi:hypothetical protein